MRISIVVPAFNEEKLLAQSLATIRAASAAFARRGWDIELIVCDNNSTDGTAALAREAGASVVFEPLNQISRARNAGAAHARGDWLVFVDADSWPTPELFDEAAQAIESGDCLAGGATPRYDIHRLDVRIPPVLWLAPLVYACWAAFHPAASATLFDVAAPLTLANFEKAWGYAPFPRHLLNTVILVTMVLAAQLVLCTLAGFAFARFEFAGRDF